MKLMMILVTFFMKHILFLKTFFFFKSNFKSASGAMHFLLTTEVKKLMFVLLYYHGMNNDFHEVAKMIIFYIFCIIDILLVLVNVAFYLFWNFWIQNICYVAQYLNWSSFLFPPLHFLKYSHLQNWMCVCLIKKKILSLKNYLNYQRY